jgi:hypothetical protein
VDLVLATSLRTNGDAVVFVPNSMSNYAQHFSASREQSCSAAHFEIKKEKASVSTKQEVILKGFGRKESRSYADYEKELLHVRAWAASTATAGPSVDG